MPNSSHENRPEESTKKQRAKAKRAKVRRNRHASLKASIASQRSPPDAAVLESVNASQVPKTAGDLPSVLYRKRHEAVMPGTDLSPGDPRFHDYKRISGPGTVYVVDKDSKEPHLVVRITLFAAMTSEDFGDFGAGLFEEVDKIQDIYRRRFRELAPMLLKDAPNVSYTSKSFRNPAHGASGVIYGIWVPSDNFTDSGADGFFYDTRYKILVDFAAINGVVEVISRRL